MFTLIALNYSYYIHTVSFCFDAASKRRESPEGKNYDFNM